MMLRSCFVTRKTFIEVACTWSRLFHTRKSHLSDFRPGTAGSEKTSSGHDSQTEETKIRSTYNNRHKLSETERRQYLNERKHQEPSQIYNREQISDKGKDLGFNREHSTRNWRIGPRVKRNDLHTPDYRRQKQPFMDRRGSEQNSLHKPDYRKSIKERQGLEQNEQRQSDYKNEKPHYRHLKTKKRVLTDRELREEEEFKKSFLEEVDASDRFGDYNVDSETSTRCNYGVTDKYKTDGRVLLERRNWSETFGTISLEDKPSLEDVLFGEEPPPKSAPDRIPADERFDDEDDGFIERPHIPLSGTNRKHIPNWYARRIEKLGKKGMVKEALDLFEKQMMEKDRVKPTYYEFGLMITLLGKVGYVQKAFNLFYKMQQMDLVPEPKVFTSLFNACAKSGIMSYGLERANKLRYLMIEQGIEPTLITYQAMISAFGMCGDTEMAFSLLDEVLRKHRPNQNLLCSALVACISDKEAGFRHAILVWRKLVQRGVKPDLASYNLLLRAIKECGVGPLTRDNNLLLIETGSQEPGSHHGNKADRKKIVSSLQMKVDPDNLGSASVVEIIEGVEPSHSMNTSPYSTLTNEKTVQKHMDREGVDTGGHREVDKPAVDGSIKHWWEYDLDKFTETKSDAVVKKAVKRDLSDILPLDPEKMPNILNPFDRSLQVVSLGMIETKEERLALCGGMKGYLSSIEREGIKPDPVTFIQLVSVVPPHEEDEVLDMMSLYDVKPDIDFFNHLIQKKAYRYENQSALAVRELIEEHKLVPNLQTYGCWAQVCGDRKDGEKLLQDMADANLQPNTPIMHSLVRKSGYNFQYKSWLMYQMKLQGIPADANLINMVEKYINRVKKVIVQKEKGEGGPGWSRAENFDARFWKFMDFYNRWITEISFKKEEHPWAEFRDKTDEGDKEAHKSSVT